MPKNLSGICFYLYNGDCYSFPNDENSMMASFILAYESFFQEKEPK